MQHLAELAVEGGNVYSYLNTKKTHQNKRNSAQRALLLYICKYCSKKKKKIASHALQTLVNLA